MNAPKRLPWPENPTKSRVLKKWSWDAKKANPNDAEAGAWLPYYGKATPEDVNDHINLVWNACKRTRHVPGERLAILSKRIQSPVNRIIASLGYKPTEAEISVLRSTANETFIVTNLTYGDNAHSGDSSSILYRNDPLNAEKELRYAQALLDLTDLRAVCAGIVALKDALDKEAGVEAMPWGVIVRDSAAELPVVSPTNPQNHQCQWVILPTRKGSAMTRAQRRKRANPWELVAVAVCDPTAGLLSSDERANLDQIHVYPRPHTLLIGAKGDDVFTVYAESHYVPGEGDYAQVARMFGGTSALKVSGFGVDCPYGGKPLPSEFDELFRRVRDTRRYLGS